MVPQKDSNTTGHSPNRNWDEKLREEICGKTTDMFMELLLGGMKTAVDLFEDYRRNIAGFQARYVFRTIDEQVSATAIFNDGEMRVLSEATDDWDVRITFATTEGFKRYLLSGGMDTLTPLLTGEVESEGNNNYIYKYGYMARDLARRMGVLDFLI